MVAGGVRRQAGEAAGEARAARAAAPAYPLAPVPDRAGPGMPRLRTAGRQKGKKRARRRREGTDGSAREWTG